MKLTFSLILVTCLCVSATVRSQDAHVSIQANKITLGRLIKAIEAQTSYKFTYSNNTFPAKLRVDVHATDKSTASVLEQALKNSGFVYKLLDNNLIAIVSSESSDEQSIAKLIPKNITGVIIDQDGIPLPGVSINVKGTNIGTVTDIKGAFKLTVPEDNSTLIVTFIGFTTQEIATTGNNAFTIKMIPEASKLNEVVITGLGSQSRETLTTSISKLDVQTLKNVPYANATSALQGSIPGVRVQSTSGQPGATPRVIIRGGASINNPNGATPLYIIDGVVRTDMNDIAATDIESLQVLKDAASTAIYGARGSNGVIIITTKSGKSGKTQISYSYDLSVSSVGKTYDFASAADYIYYGRMGILAAAEKNPAALSRLTLANGMGTGNDLTANTAFTPQYLTAANQYKLNEGWQSIADPVDPTKTIIYKETDFQKLLYKTGISHNNYVTASGGNEKATFNTGLGYLSNQGTADGTDFKRLTFNLNGKLQVTNKLNIGGRLNYSSTSMQEVYSTIENVLFRSAALPSTAKYTFEDGTLAPGASRTLGNPDYYKDRVAGDNSNDKLTMSLNSKWDISRDLFFEPQVSLYKNNTDAYAFLPSYQNGPGSGNLIKTRTATGSSNKFLQYQADGVLTYRKSILAAHNFEGKFGFSYLNRTASGLSATGNGASTDLVPTLNASAVPVSVSGSTSTFRLISYFSRFNYDYQEKYLLSASLRYDGASNLGENNQWGIFPGVSVGWNVHKEKFWEFLPENLVNLKIRASYGLNGKIDALSDFQAQGVYNVGDQYGGNAAITNTIIPNQNLKWESSKTFDVGTDIGLFNNRVSIIFDYYRRVNDNLLTTLTLPQSTGFATVVTNFGSLENKGYEFEINANLLSPGAKLKWNIGLNAAKVTNKILQLPNNGVANNRVGGFFVYDPSTGGYAWLGGLQEGGRIGDMYAYKQVSIYATDAEAAAGPVDNIVAGSNKKKFGGDVNWLDADNNGIIDERDRTYMGNPYPTWTGGFSNTLTYKNISLYARFDFTTGHTIYNYARGFFDNNWQGDVLMTKAYIENSWKKQGDITDVPRYYWNDQTQFNTFRGNSTYYESGNFLAVRELTLSYNIPKQLLEKLHINSLRFNITGNNLYYFTKYKGLNPEEGGEDRGHYPMPRNVIFGASITL